MAKPKAKVDEQQRRHNQVVGAALEACKIKGWTAVVEGVDPKHHLATIKISRYFDYQQVTGLIHLTIDKGVKFRIENTSFHSYGQRELLDTIDFKLGELGWQKPESSKEKQEQQAKNSALQIDQLLTKLLANFHRAVRQLRQRHDNRVPYAINDEYDAQDLLHAILTAYFDDVRPEEYTPSYAGSSSKVDFLLKAEKAVIEVKFATQKLREKQIGEQLIIDIKKYAGHPDCSRLYCLVYDPNENIKNAIGFERDLSGIHGTLTVKVVVVPH